MHIFRHLHFKLAGMSVPDWPNSYGYNMFLFPPRLWIGGILYEHTHRLMGTVVGMLSIWFDESSVGRPSIARVVIIHDGLYGV